MMNMFEESSAPPDAQSYRQANDGAASTPKTEPKYTATRSGRNLVVCIDGTANQFSKRNTHVVELYSRLLKDDDQLTYYNSGIGTFVKRTNRFARLKQTVVHALDMAFALNLKNICLHAYQWLSENYRPGDRIFLFGFSRGAYQVRIIAGMIHVVGLLHKGNNEQIPFAYELYVASTVDAGGRIPNDPSSGSTREQKKRRKQEAEHQETMGLCRKFKETLSHKDVTVHFVGAWDTVSSVGITRGPTLPETTTGMTHVRAFRHALSLDDPRVKFLPEFANGGAGPLPGATCDVKEVWFVGSHSDVGGGSMPNQELDKFGPSLRWMLYEALEHGLLVAPVQGNWADPQLILPTSFFFKLLEYLPIRRLSYGRPDNTKKWIPHHFGGRHIQPGQLIHSSVLDYMQQNPGYCPKASLPLDGTLSWDAIKRLKPGDPVIEEDCLSVETKRFLDHLQAMTKTPAASSDIGLPPLRIIAPFKNLVLPHLGQQSILDYPHAADILLKGLKRVSELQHVNEQQRHVVVVAIAAALAVFDSNPLDSQPYSCSSLVQWLGYPVPRRHRAKIAGVFGEGLKGHEGAVSAVICSPDCRYIASASYNGTIRLWDAQTLSMVGEPLRGHEGSIYSIAFSPDSVHIASGGADATVRIWDVQTLQAVGEPLRGHAHAVFSVSFSFDGRTIASGSADGTILLWNAETGDPVRESIAGHEDSVRSVTFAPGDTHLVSASDDTTICIWDLATHEKLKVFEGHTGAVKSIALSYDGKRIVSGSDDATVRIWDTETGEAVGNPIRGHAGAVLSVVFTPDNKYALSGSADGTIRRWRAGTGEAVGDHLCGHAAGVLSLTFSQHGKRIVSGSEDCTLRVW